MWAEAAELDAREFNIHDCDIVDVGQFYFLFFICIVFWNFIFVVGWIKANLSINCMRWRKKFLKQQRPMHDSIFLNYINEFCFCFFTKNIIFDSNKTKRQREWRSDIRRAASRMEGIFEKKNQFLKKKKFMYKYN